MQQARKDRNTPWVGFNNVGPAYVHLVRVGGEPGTLVGIDPHTGIVHQICYQSFAAGVVGRVNVTYSDFRPAGPSIRSPPWGRSTTSRSSPTTWRASR